MDNEDYDGVMALVGEIIRQAIIDYMRVIPPITPDMSDEKRNQIAQWQHDKGSAQAFFRSSRLFKLSQIDFDWLIEQYNKGAFTKRADDE